MRSEGAACEAGSACRRALVDEARVADVTAAGGEAKHLLPRERPDEVAAAIVEFVKHAH